MTGAIILAAGSSSRMGRSKQMLDIKGETLLEKTVHSVINSNIDNSVVVLGANEAAHREVLSKATVDIISNAAWEKGMGSSIKAGLTHLLSKHPQLESVVILVCDQPFLNHQILAALIAKHRETGKQIVASYYSHQPGVPVLFGRRYFEKLATLPDHRGAKNIVTQNPSDLATVPFPGGEIDLDTMEDYEAFLLRGRYSHEGG